MKRSSKIILLVVALVLIAIPVLGCNGAAGDATATPKTSATTAAPGVTDPPATSYGPYKGLVITGNFAQVTELQSKGFDFRINMDYKMEGGIGQRNFWGAEKFIDGPDALDLAQSAKYFTVPFASDDKAVYNPEKYIELMENGDIPYSWADNNAASFNVAALPADTNKVLILDYTDNKDKWTDDQVASRGADGVTPEWTQELIDHELLPLVEKIQRRFPDAQIYITSFYPLCADFGHGDVEKYPDADRRFDWTENPWAKVFAENDLVASSNVIKDWTATQTNVNYINIFESGYVDADNHAKEEYVHSFSYGNWRNNAGIQVLGDFYMEKMGLPKPSVAYPDWYK